MSGGVARGQDGGIVFARFANGHDVADLDLSGGDITFAAIQLNMTMSDDLSGLRAARAAAPGRT